MQLLLIRHGQTLENIQMICQGQSIGTLSPLGIAQAEALAEQLGEEKVDKLYTSDLERARHTARIIFKDHVGLSAQVDERLRERSFGPLERLPLPEGINFGDEIEGAEPIASVLARVEDFLHMLEREHSGEKIAIVSHGITLRALMSLVTGKDFSELAIPENCTPYYLEK